MNRRSFFSFLAGAPLAVAAGKQGPSPMLQTGRDGMNVISVPLDPPGAIQIVDYDILEARVMRSVSRNLTYIQTAASARYSA